MLRLLSRSRAYMVLTKPRIIELLLVTTVPTMFVAARFTEAGAWPNWIALSAAVIGGTFAAGGANTFNMVVDRDIDKLMERTQNRPLATGAIGVGAAIVFGVILEVLAFTILAVFANFLAAILAISATLFYVFVYSLWLKRSSEQNIVIGGAAGAVPVLVGWAAQTGRLDWPPVILFAIIFFWTPPHFWALAIKYKEDYAKASVPMLPVVRTLKWVSVRILAYTILLVALTIIFHPIADMGLIYIIAASILGAVFIFMSVDLIKRATPKKAMALFQYSITYVALLFSVMAIDRLILA